MTYKVSACVCNRVGKNLLNFLMSEGHDIEFVVTCKHDPFENEIYDICKANEIKCYRYLDVNSQYFIDKIKDQAIDIVLLLWFPTIVKSECIQAAKIGFINLHPSLLPYNRGKHPYYWSIVDNTPAGVSLHFIDKNIDEGDILVQEEIEVPITMTADQLYEKSLNTIENLFKSSYDSIIKNKITPKKQNSKNSTFHWAKEIETHSCIELQKTYKAIDLINIIRARSFQGNPSSYFNLNGKKYYINIEIRDADQG